MFPSYLEQGRQLLQVLRKSKPPRKTLAAGPPIYPTTSIAGKCDQQSSKPAAITAASNNAVRLKGGTRGIPVDHAGTAVNVALGSR